MKCIRDDEGNVLVQERDIKDTWKKYFHKLFNERYEILSGLNKLEMRGGLKL